MATELLHDHILRLAFLADTDRPAQLSTEDLFWKLEDPHLALPKIKECLEWLVQQGDMVVDRGKYGLSKAKFFEMKAQYAHLAPRGIAIWLAPIAPIHVPMPVPIVATATAPEVQAIATTPAAPEVLHLEALPVELPRPVTSADAFPVNSPSFETPAEALPPTLSQVVPEVPEIPAPIIAEVATVAATNSSPVVHTSNDTAQPVPTNTGEWVLQIRPSQRQVLFLLLAAQVILAGLQGILTWIGEWGGIIPGLQLGSMIAVAISFWYGYQILRKGHFVVHPTPHNQ